MVEIYKGNPFVSRTIISKNNGVFNVEYWIGNKAEYKVKFDTHERLWQQEMA